MSKQISYNRCECRQITDFMQAIRLVTANLAAMYLTSGTERVKHEKIYIFFVV